MTNVNLGIRIDRVFYTLSAADYLDPTLILQRHRRNRTQMGTPMTASLSVRVIPVGVILEEREDSIVSRDGFICFLSLELSCFESIRIESPNRAQRCRVAIQSCGGQIHAMNDDAGIPLTMYPVHFEATATSKFFPSVSWSKDVPFQFDYSDDLVACFNYWNSPSANWGFTSNQKIPLTYELTNIWQLMTYPEGEFGIHIDHILLDLTPPSAEHADAQCVEDKP